MADLVALEAFLAEPRNVMVAAIRKNGRPQMTPNWFLWDGGRFLISTTKDRAKYRMFLRDPRTQLAIDDPTGFRSVLVDGIVTIWDDLDAALPSFRAIRTKHNRPMGDDAALKAELAGEARILLVVTPDKAIDQWRVIGF